MLYVLYRGHIAHIAHIAWMDPGESGCSVACLVRYSTYSTYSKETGESGCSVGCLVRYSTYSTYSMDPGESGAGWGPYSTYSTYSMELGGSGAGHIAARRPTVRLWARHVRQGCSARAGGLQRSVRVRSGFCLVCALKRQAPVSRITGRCTRPSNSPPWRSPCRTRTFACRAQSP